MNRAGTRLCAASVALFVVMWSSAFGGISLISQTDNVQISGSAGILGGAAGTPFDQESSATVNTPFSATLQNTSTASQTVFAMASASQNSLLAVSGQSLSLTATGQGSFQAAGTEATASTSSSYYVVFSVVAPTPYTLTESTDQEGYVDLNDGDVGAYLYPAQLASGATPPSGVSSLVPLLTDPKFAAGGPQTFSGTLSAGTYTLEGSYVAGGPNATASGSFSIDFSAGTASTNGGSGGSGAGGTTAVPLPAAFWPAAAVLAVICLGLARYRRLAR